MKTDPMKRPKLQAAKRGLPTLCLAALLGCSHNANQNAPGVSPAPETSPAATPRPVPTKIPVMRFPPRSEAEMKKSINAHLKTWQRSIETRDADKHLEHYADRIETYYNAADVNKAFVRDDRRRAFERFDTLEVELINIDVYLESKDAAIVVFDKSWDFKRGESFSNGLVQQEIRLRKIENEWLIVSEKDLEVYRKREE